VENKSPIICFGITAGAGKRSSYWRLRAGAKQPELFLEREAYGKKLHFSLHASGRWHMKEGRHERISWVRPGEVVPGYTRAVGIVQPVAVAHRADAAPDDVVLVPVADDAEPTTFSLFIERPGANVNSWPGKTLTARALWGASRSPPAPVPDASLPDKSRSSPVARSFLVPPMTSCGGFARWPHGVR
jgi:hypothetical protein